MKKKRVLKKWVAYILILLDTVLSMLLCGEWASIKLQVIASVCSLGFIILTLNPISDSKLFLESEVD